MRGADLLVRTLAEAGVDTIFSLSGNQIMPIYDACLDAGIDIVHTRHEAAAVFMADAWAQVTGKVGVALVTAAPGAANALGPLFTARRSESPVLFLTGDSPLAQDGRGAFQELDQVSMTAPLTKLSFRPAAPGDLGKDIARGIRTALAGRPGPVHIALPFDCLTGDTSGAAIPQADAVAPDVETVSPDTVSRLLSEIGRAERPLILLGPALNASRTNGLPENLAAAVDAPVVAMESPRGLRDPSLGAFTEALGAADLIVALGKPVDFTVGFGGGSAEACRWIFVDTEEAERARAHRNLGTCLQEAIAGDPRAMADALAKVGSGGEGRAEWRRRVRDLIQARAFPQEITGAGGTITSQTLCAAVQRRIEAAESSIVICDGGEFGQWAQAATAGTRRLINGPSGAIGGGLCYALAAKKADPDAAVVALMGDGTVGFHFAEFETAARARTPFVAIIGNDGLWNAEHQIQLRDYGPDRLVGCTLSPARYDLAAAALGCHGELVTDPEALDGALERAFAADVPACVDVRIEGLAAPSVPKQD